MCVPFGTLATCRNLKLHIPLKTKQIFRLNLKPKRMFVSSVNQ